MKTFLPVLAALFAYFPVNGMYSVTEKPDCPEESCFDTQIIGEEKQDSCTTYTLEISQDGACRYALSHFSIEIPCGEISDVTNSAGWAMEVGTTDPTTGITGIKIDDIKDFGESKDPQSFTVTYTVCNTGACQSGELIPSRVAYKAATCVHYDEVELPYVPMSATLSASDLACAGISQGAIDLELQGGAAPYTYSWSNGQSSEDLSGLAAGLYQISITDATGAILELETEVREPEALQIQESITHASCQNSGSIALSLSGGTAPYSYSWSTGSTEAALTDAAAGSYSVIVTDANGCVISQSFEIEEAGGMLVSISGGDTCGTSDLSAEATGGTAPFTYEWSTGETTAAITAGQTGTYTLTVTDARGCTATSSKEVSLENAPQLDLNPIAPICANGTDGSIELTVTGGSGDYTYQWNNGQTSEDLSGLGAGDYRVTVTDANGCSATASTTLEKPKSIFIHQLAVIQPDCQGNLGSITVEAYFGTAPYTYEWSNGETATSISGLSPGSYEITVTDANGCSSSRTIRIQEPSTPQLSISGGNCSSTLSATVSGGSGPYTYEWGTGETTSTIDITEAGSYELTVTDANGCSSTESITANDPAQAISLTYTSQEPTCYGGSDGSIDLTVAGGSSNYSIAWSNGETSEDLSGLAAGTYTVTVSNESGCTATETVTLTAPKSIFIHQQEVQHVSCQGEGGSISVLAYFGTAPYTYQWNNGETGTKIENLEKGSYTVVVTDAKGCSSQRSFFISEDLPPNVQITSKGCGNDFQLSAAVSGGKAPFSYSWQSGQTTSSINAPAGDYTVTVSDANGCSNTASITLTETESPLDLAITVVPVNCAGGKGSASLQVSGGTSPYTYDWSDGSTGSEIQNLEAGVYSVQVTEAGGCSEVLAFTISEPEPISITAVVENNEACGEPSGSISVEVSGGKSPYTYAWNTEAETQNLSQLDAGNYTLTVEDAMGCVAIRSFTIENAAGGSAPTALLQSCADTLICRGTSANLPVHFTGEGPFNLSYTDGSTEYNISTSANPYMLEVSPESSTSYQLLAVSNSCGEGNVSGLLNVQIADCEKTNICEEGCFSTNILSRQTNGSCETISLQVNSDGSCRYALSHFNVAVGCGTISEASNSEGWPMELNALDPTTGLYGLKVDEIRNFGEDDGAQSFTVTYTICSEDTSCQESLQSCGPLVAYKAGSCVYYGKATEEAFFAKETQKSQARMVLNPDFTLYPNPYAQGQKLNLSIQDLSREGKATLKISNMMGLEIYKGQHQISPEHNGINLIIQEMTSGTYFISLEVEGHVISKQLYVL